MKDIDAKEEPDLARVNSPAAEDVVEAVRSYFNLDGANRILVRKEGDPKCRKVAMYLTSKYCRRITGLSEIAARYGVTLNGLSSAVACFKTMLARNRKLQRELDEIESILLWKE